MKQIIVIRKDLNMRKGKMCAQSAHASLSIILKNIDINSAEVNISLSQDLVRWIKNGQKKIVVSVNSEEELVKIYNSAKIKNILCALVIDSGQTEFNGIATKTCCAIGPENTECLNNITGDLKLI